MHTAAEKGTKPSAVSMDSSGAPGILPSAPGCALGKPLPGLPSSRQNSRLRLARLSTAGAIAAILANPLNVTFPVSGSTSRSVSPIGS